MRAKLKWCPNSVSGANHCYVSQSLWDFYEGGDCFSLCLFFLPGKQACIKPDLYKKDSIHILCFVPPHLATPCVCGTQKGKGVPQGGGIFSLPQMALNQLHITKPPCRAPGPGYSCWDKFIHDCMGSCLIEAHYFHFLLTPRTPRGAAQASQGQGVEQLLLLVGKRERMRDDSALTQHCCLCGWHCLWGGASC